MTNDKNVHRENHARQRAAMTPEELADEQRVADECRRTPRESDHAARRRTDELASAGARRALAGESSSMGGERDAIEGERSPALAARVHLELFHCEPYDCRLTRQACAKRHVLARGLPPANPKKGATDEAMRVGRCVPCAVGRENARALKMDVPTRRKRRGGAKRQADIERAQSRKREREAAASASEKPAPNAAHREAAAAPSTPPAAEETPSRRWCAPADEAPVESAPAPPVPAKRRRGAPRPTASDEAEAWLASLSTAERARVVELVLAVVSTTDAGRVYARAVLAHRLLELSIPDTIAHLGSPAGLTEAACSSAVHRGRWVVSRALRQRSLLVPPAALAELEAFTPHVLALMAASRSDAGKPRPEAQGRRAPRKARPESRELPLFDHEGRPHGPGARALAAREGTRCTGSGATPSPSADREAPEHRRCGGGDLDDMDGA